MLTEQTNGIDNDSLSGVISIGSALNLDEMKGTLILDGEEDDELNDEKSKLSLPESVLLPSEITFENKLPATVSAPSNDAVDAKTMTNNEHRENCRYKQSMLLAFVAMLFFIASTMSFGYIRAKNELRHLEASLQRQRSLTLLLSHERLALTKRVASLEQDLINYKSAYANKKLFSNHDDIGEDTLVMFENCHFKAALTAGACYKDWQSWFNEYMFEKESSAKTSRDEEENFAYQLFDSLKGTSRQSYSFVEEGIKNMTFDGVDLAAFVVSSVTALGGVHQHYGDGSEPLMKLAKSIVDESSSFARRIEQHSSKTLSRAVDFSTTWLKSVLDVVSEEELVAWN